MDNLSKIKEILDSSLRIPSYEKYPPNSSRSTADDSHFSQQPMTINPPSTLSPSVQNNEDALISDTHSRKRFYKSNLLLGGLFLAAFLSFEAISTISINQADNLKSWIAKMAAEQDKTPQEIHYELRKEFGYKSYMRINKWTYARIYLKLNLF